MEQLRDVGLPGTCGKIHRGVVGDRALTSYPPLGSWHEVGGLGWGLVLRVSARSRVKQEAGWQGWYQAASPGERKDALLMLARTATP